MRQTLPFGGRRQEKFMYNPEQQALLDLQKIDLEILSLRNVYAEHPAHKKMGEIEAAREKLHHASELLDEKIHDLDKVVTAGHDEIEKAQAKVTAEQLEMNKISDPRTAQVLTKDIDTLKRRIDKIEFDEIGLLEQLDELQGKKKQLDEKCVLLDEAHAKTEAGLASLKAQIDEKMGTLLEKKSQFKELLSPELFEQYSAIAKAKKNVAVGEFINETCTVCRVKLATTQIDAILENSGGVCICPSCKRLIVVA